MKKPKLGTALLALIVALLPEASKANWQFTRWGMSASDIVRATAGKAAGTTLEEQKDLKLNGMDEKILLKAPYNSGALQFTAYFGFDSGGKLVTVSLESLDRRAEDIFMGLSSKYGPPRTQTKDSIAWYAEWHDGDETIAFSCIRPLKPMSVGVNYLARHTANNSGL